MHACSRNKTSCLHQALKPADLMLLAVIRVAGPVWHLWCSAAFLCFQGRAVRACSKNKMSCVHRDLKPANLMLGGIPHDSTDLRLGGELGVVKIAGP